MKVFVAGATGAIGKPLVKELLARTHDVVGLARSDANERLLTEVGATARRANLFDVDALTRAAEGADVIVRAATHIPTGSRTSAAEWAVNDRIRREGTRALLEAARRVGARRYLQESIVWLARPPTGAAFDEDAPPHPDGIVASALDAERAAAEAMKTGGIQTATLRLGWLYGPDTAHTREFASMLRKRRIPILGTGEAPMAFLHVDDAARAFADAAQSSVTGLYHVVDDKPTPVGEFFRDLATRVGAPAPMRVPKWVGRLAAGEYITRFLTTPLVTSNARFRAATGWRPRYPTVREGLEQTVEAWRASGTMPA